MSRRLALLLLLPTAAACGTVGRDDELPARPCTGLGPWTEHGPLQVCLGTAEAVSGPGAAAAAGWCVADAARPCADDGACAPTEQCRCGLCRVVRCSSSDECAGGRTCIVALGRCAATCDPAAADSCPPDFVCHLGGCVAACAGDADCAHGEACDDRRRCVAAPCGDDDDCDPGRRCEIQAVAAEALHPDVVDDDGVAWVAAELRRDGRSEIVRLDRTASLRLVASDGPPLLTPQEAWEGDRVGAPAVARVEGSTWLFYAGGDDAGLGLAVADADGVFRRRTDGPLLAPTTAWEAGRIGAPAVWPVGGELRLLYVGGDGAGLGLALPETGGTAWRKLDDGPLVAPDALGVPERWVDLAAIGEPDVVDAADDGSALWFVAGRGRVLGGGIGPDEAPLEWSLGVLLVEPHLLLPPLPLRRPGPWGPVAAGRTGVGPEAVREERAPGARRTADGWELLYVEPGDAGRGARLRSAACP